MQLVKSGLIIAALATGHIPESAGTNTPSGPPKGSCERTVRGSPTSACKSAMKKMKQTAADMGFMTISVLSPGKTPGVAAKQRHCQLENAIIPPNHSEREAGQSQRLSC